MGQGPVLVIPASGAKFDGESARVAGVPSDSPEIEIRDDQTKEQALANALQVSGKRHMLLCVDFNGNTTCTARVIRKVGAASYYDIDYTSMTLDVTDTPDGTEIRAIPIYGSDEVTVQFEAVAGAPLAEGSGIKVVMRLI